MTTQTFWFTVGLIATAIMVITPLAHRAFGGASGERAAVRLAGAVATLSFTIGSGVVAAAMAVPWFGIAATLALNELRAIGYLSLLRRPSAAVLRPLATWVWMASGAGWLIAHRLGLEPLGFDRGITLLTVAHFHVAGLGLTALLTLTHGRRPGSTLLAAMWLHQAGMLAVAAGLTFSDHLEVAGAAAVTVALAVWATIVVGWLRGGIRGLARLLLVVAAVTWILPMVLALGWALAPFLPEPVVTTFETMLRYHAAPQTVGLVLCGLAGIMLTDPACENPPLADPSAHHTTREAADAVAQRTHA